MKLWIARNENSSLWLFNRKPFLDEYWVAQGDDAEAYVIDDELFPEVTFENSPQEIELKLINEIVGVIESPSKTFPRANQFEVGASYRR